LIKDQQSIISGLITRFIPNSTDEKKLKIIPYIASGMSFVMVGSCWVSRAPTLDFVAPGVGRVVGESSNSVVSRLSKLCNEKTGRCAGSSGLCEPIIPVFAGVCMPLRVICSVLFFNWKLHFSYCSYKST